MKKIANLLFILISILVLTSCQSKNNYLNKFEKFVCTVEQGCANYSTEDWAGADAQFQAFTESEYHKYENKLTPEDQNQLGRLCARYAKVRYKSALRQAGNYIEDVMNTVEEFVNEFDEEGKDEE